MKKKVKEDFKLKSSSELKKLLKDSEDLLFRLRLDKVQNKLKNQRQIFWERKKIALFLTLINEKNFQALLINEKNEMEKMTKTKEVKEKKNAKG